MKYAPSSARETQRLFASGLYLLVAAIALIVFTIELSTASDVIHCVEILGVAAAFFLIENLTILSRKGLLKRLSQGKPFQSRSK